MQMCLLCYSCHIMNWLELLVLASKSGSMDQKANNNRKKTPQNQTPKTNKNPNQTNQTKTNQPKNPQETTGKNPTPKELQYGRKEAIKKRYGHFLFFLRNQDELQIFHRLYVFPVAVNICSFPKERGDAQGSCVFRL